MARISAAEAGGANVLIALDLVAWSEGTSRSPFTKDDGYDVLVGGVSGPPGPFPKICSGYAAHPDILVTVSLKSIPTLKSTAAGRYQAIYATWMEAVVRYKLLGGFSPITQDRFGIHKFTERGAMAAILAGDWPTFISKVNKEWASFTGSPYNQNPHPLADMLAQVSHLQATA